MVVQPTMANSVPEIEANTVGLPPLSEPNKRVSVTVPFCAVNCSSAYMRLSREKFDQGYWVNAFKPCVEFGPSALMEVRKVLPVPSVLIFHSPFLLVSPVVLATL